MSIRQVLPPLFLALVVSGCSVPQASAPDNEPAPVSPLPPSASTETDLATIEACSLLTAEEATYLAVPAQGEPEELSGLRRCQWFSPGGGGVSTTINEDLGVDGLNLADASSITDIAIGRYQARRVEETSGPGYCSIFFEVGDTANVTVSALYRGDTPRACATADQAAAFVEPKLP